MILFQLKPFFQTSCSYGEDGSTKNWCQQQRKEATLSGGKFIFICSITNLSYIAYTNSHSQTTFVALCISLNVLCYAFSLHLSDTLLLARLNLSPISMAAKFESLNLKIFSQQNNFSSIKTNEWISSKLLSSSWTCSHNENANDDIDCLHICVRLSITVIPQFSRDSIKINIDTKFQIYFQLQYEINREKKCCMKETNSIQNYAIIMQISFNSYCHFIYLQIFMLHIFKLCTRLGSEQNYLASFA